MLIHPEVADALASVRPVVALESTIISHGLPRPDNLLIARYIETAVRAVGVVPATVAMSAGRRGSGWTTTRWPCCPVTRPWSR